MSQPLQTAATLKRLIQVRMNALHDVQEDDEQVFATEVEWHPADESGCNWNMHGYRGPAAYASEVRLLINRMRRQYRLTQDFQPID